MTTRPTLAELETRHAALEAENRYLRRSTHEVQRYARHLRELPARPFHPLSGVPFSPAEEQMARQLAGESRCRAAGRSA